MLPNSPMRKTIVEIGLSLRQHRSVLLALAGIVFIAGCATRPSTPPPEPVYFNLSNATLDRVLGRLIKRESGIWAMIPNQPKGLILGERVAYRSNENEKNWTEYLLTSLRSEHLAETDVIRQMKAAQREDSELRFRTERLSDRAYLFEYQSADRNTRKLAKIFSLPGGDFWVTYACRDKVDHARWREWVSVIRSFEPQDDAIKNPLEAGRMIAFSPSNVGRLKVDLKALTAVEEEPRQRFIPSPAFAFRRDLAGTTGRATLSVLIASDGRVAEASSITSFPVQLGPALAQAYQRARFHPAQINGHAVECRVDIQVSLPLLVNSAR